ncbi:hypothetical protein [Plastoroseomonas hellenica]|uniref:Carrier domain-containing protein n=1 Tax=Plastoroseomonas hellenica TaxID=2687306 RepID=A0ABS5F3R2_9PROT|nr:hypothetical protein [Plastoroseomonas hellenica]MBR0645967.1 hypothetical protein [Plastoroseomonas hellenica]MBR0667180.1 hypothetical protein [Plastoroseomonas hellenica]
MMQVDAASLREEDGVETMAIWDSLRVITLASMIEFHYDIVLANADIENLTSVQRVRDVVARYAQS